MSSSSMLNQLTNKGDTAAAAEAGGVVCGWRLSVNNNSSVTTIHILILTIFGHLSIAIIMGPIVVSRKPCKCPKCGGKVVKIVYGMPAPELY